jgi:hypothetical protein
MIKIEISCQPEEFDAHLKSLGLMKRATEAENLVQWAHVDPPTPEKQEAVDPEDAADVAAYDTAIAEMEADGRETIPAKEVFDRAKAKNADADTTMDGDRERGKPGPGHRRRTDKQIKEDEAYFASLAKPVGGEPAPLAPGAEPLISTGEERLNPQDEADEAAETAARQSDKPTIEDLRAAVGRYTAKFGVKASIEAIRTVVGCPIIEVPEDQIAAAIGRVEAAIAGEAPAIIKAGVSSTDSGTDPRGVFPEPTEAPQATKSDVVEAIKAYGVKFDGVSDDPKKMPFTQEDMPKIFTSAFGPGVVGLKTAPQTPEGYGKALGAINAALRDNPFGRAVR